MTVKPKSRKPAKGPKRKPKPKPKPDPPMFGIYLASVRPRGAARLVAARRAEATTTFSERYARRFPDEAKARAWLDDGHRAELAGFRPIVTRLSTAPHSRSKRP